MSDTEVNQDRTSLNNDLNYDILNDLCSNNEDYFLNDGSETGYRLYNSFVSMKNSILILRLFKADLCGLVSKFDFDEKTPGNGCRSFLIVVNYAVLHGIAINKKVCLKRSSVLFRKSVICKEVESCAGIFSSLETLAGNLKSLVQNLKDDELWLSGATPEELLLKTKNVDQCCFYGRSLGFQFCESIRPIVRFVNLSMVIFSEAYYSRGSFFAKARNSVTTTAKYLTDPEERAKRIVNISLNANVDFCKSFWFLAESELMKQVPIMVGQNVAVSKIIQIPPEPLTITIDNKDIEVLIPNSHIGKRPVQVRLISYEAREGMVGEGQAKGKILPPSRGLLFHCHGGGFIAQSSQSHELYLRDWAKELKVPILSIDYNLAPQAPYPRALEEVTYAYCWALKNCHLLGSTGERIVFAGDSAGGNLLLGATLRCLKMGLPIAKGIFAAYTPVWINTVVSPSRLLSVMDPLIPLGFLIRCLKAYISPSLLENGFLNDASASDTESFEEISQSDLVELQAHKSPVSETTESMTYSSLSSPTPENATATVREVDISDINCSDVNGACSQNVNMTELLEKYILDSDTDTDGSKVPILRQENIASSDEKTLQSRVTSIMTCLREQIGGWVLGSRSEAAILLDSQKNTNLLDEVRVVWPDDPFLSPYLASDEMLKKLPPVKVLTVHMDPCLDDCVMFCKKLKRLGNNVTLDVLDGLPHGFLNFALLSKEASEGSKLCIRRITELLDLESSSSQQD